MESREAYEAWRELDSRQEVETQQNTNVICSVIDHTLWNAVSAIEELDEWNDCDIDACHDQIEDTLSDLIDYFRRNK